MYIGKILRDGRQSTVLGAEIASYHVEHFVMNAAVAGDKFRLIDRMRVAAEIGDASSGFPDNESTCGHVPGIQLNLPKAVESGRRNIAEIQGRASRAPHSLSLQSEAYEVIQVIVRSISDVICKAGDRQSFAEPRRL